MPTRVKPMRTEAGPPVWKAEPELTNRPAPIAPPLRWVVSMGSEASWWGRGDLHGDHLHVAALQRALELILVGVDHGDIVSVHTELAALCLVVERTRLRVDGKAMVILLDLAALASETHGGRE